MPFPCEESGIVYGLKSLSQGHLLERKLVSVWCRLELPGPCPTDEVRDARARRYLAGQDACPGWRADRACRVARREPHSLRRQAINVRRLVEGLGIVAAKVHEAQVISENQHDVAPAYRLHGCRYTRRCGDDGGSDQHEFSYLVMYHLRLPDLGP